MQGGCHSHQGPSLREHFWGGIQALTDVLQPNREQRSLPQQAHANKEKGEKQRHQNKGWSISWGSLSRWVGIQESWAFREPVKARQVINFPDWRSLLRFQIFSRKKNAFHSSVGFLSVSLNHLLPLTWFVYRICQICNKHGLIKRLMECYFRTALSCSKPVLMTVSDA